MTNANDMTVYNQMTMTLLKQIQDNKERYDTEIKLLDINHQAELVRQKHAMMDIEKKYMTLCEEMRVLKTENAELKMAVEKALKKVFEEKNDSNDEKEIIANTTYANHDEIINWYRFNRNDHQSDMKFYLLNNNIDASCVDFKKIFCMENLEKFLLVKNDQGEEKPQARFDSIKRINNLFEKKGIKINDMTVFLAKERDFSHAREIIPESSVETIRNTVDEMIEWGLKHKNRLYQQVALVYLFSRNIATRQNFYSDCYIINDMSEFTQNMQKAYILSTNELKVAESALTKTKAGQDKTPKGCKNGFLTVQHTQRCSEILQEWKNGGQRFVLENKENRPVKVETFCKQKERFIEEYTKEKKVEKLKNIDANSMRQLSAFESRKDNDSDNIVKTAKAMNHSVNTHEKQYNRVK